MELLQGDVFDRLFIDGKWQRAFHLETVDTYSTPDESEPFRKFLDGEPDDFAWLDWWLALIRDVTSAGKIVQRARVVTVPHVDYTRWGLTVSPRNIAAGEDIRWLPRHQIDPSELSADDFWLFDDDLVAFSIFTPDGAGAGGATTTDPTIVGYCRTIRDRVWNAATPHAEYGSAQSRRDERSRGP